MLISKGCSFERGVHMQRAPIKKNNKPIVQQRGDQMNQAKASINFLSLVKVYNQYKLVKCMYMLM